MESKKNNRKSTFLKSKVSFSSQILTPQLQQIMQDFHQSRNEFDSWKDTTDQILETLSKIFHNHQLQPQHFQQLGTIFQQNHREQIEPLQALLSQLQLVGTKAVPAKQEQILHTIAKQYKSMTNVLLNLHSCQFDLALVDLMHSPQWLDDLISHLDAFFPVWCSQKFVHFCVFILEHAKHHTEGHDFLWLLHKFWAKHLFWKIYSESESFQQLLHSTEYIPVMMQFLKPHPPSESHNKVCAYVMNKLSTKPLHFTGSDDAIYTCVYRCLSQSLVSCFRINRSMFDRYSQMLVKYLETYADTLTTSKSNMDYLTMACNPIITSLLSTELAMYLVMFSNSLLDKHPSFVYVCDRCLVASHHHQSFLYTYLFNLLYGVLDSNPDISYRQYEIYVNLFHPTNDNTSTATSVQTTTATATSAQTTTATATMITVSPNTTRIMLEHPLRKRKRDEKNNEEEVDRYLPKKQCVLPQDCPALFDEWVKRLQTLRGDKLPNLAIVNHPSLWNNFKQDLLFHTNLFKAWSALAESF
jgi:hypothetical protein